MAKKRGTYGNGTVYYSEKKEKFICQKTVTLDSGTTKRITGSGDTEAKAVRKCKENIKKALEECSKGRGEKKKVPLKAGKEEQTLSYFVEKSLQKKSDIELTTQQNYNFYFIPHIKKSWLGDMDIRKITEEDLMKYYEEKLKTGKLHTREPQGLSVRTVNMLRGLIDGGFAAAFESGVLEKNIHKSIKKFKKGTKMTIDVEEVKRRYQTNTEVEEMEEQQEKIKAMTEEQLNLFLDMAKPTRNYYLYLFTVMTGLRKGEDMAFEN